MTDQAFNQADALSRGEAVPGAPGACATCGHLTLWHGVNGRYRRKPCQRCDCTAFTAADDALPASSSSARKTPAPATAQLALFTLGEIT